MFYTVKSEKSINLRIDTDNLSLIYINLIKSKNFKYLKQFKNIRLLKQSCTVVNIDITL